jgi:2,3-bisphosphoglycerate-dependent phosphoglycerate mutase
LLTTDYKETEFFMQLYIIRHAQSENNAIWARTESSDGRLSDPGVTDIGHQQAQHLARFLAKSGGGEQPDRWDSYNIAGFNLTHLYCSYMLRAVITGQYISEATGVPLRAWEAVHEWGGMYEHGSETEERIPVAGPNRAFFAENFPQFVVEDTLGEGGWWNFRPYEPPLETFKRAAKFLNELLERHSGEDRVGIVTHGGFSDSLVKVLLGHRPLYSRFAEGFDGDTIPGELMTNAPEEMWFRLNNASVSRIDFFPERYVLVYWNRIDFLPGELIT